MNMIRFALRKPVAIMVVIAAIGFFSILTLKKIQVDIFPEVESPAIYIAMPYGGLTPSSMDGFMANEFQKVLVFVSGVRDMEFKSVQGFTLMKLNFYPGTDMAQSAAEVSTMVSRAMAFLPPGAVPPQVVRFDGGSLPVGQLVFKSEERSIGEIQNLVITRVRPMFVTIPGVTAPAPFGGNARSIVVNVNPELMRSYGISEDEVMSSILKNSFPSPAGNIRIGDQNFMSPSNTMAKGPEEFLAIPIKKEGNSTVYVKNIATVEDGQDVVTGHAIVNGKRSIYLPVIKKAGASTLEVVKNLRKSLPQLSEALPEDVRVEYVFDQSKYISSSIQNLIHEGILGALFTGLMVLLFLGDRRGALIVVLTIPISLLTAVLILNAFGQTINLMTLSGLALAIGILVDEATVSIENIHQHFERGKPKARAILDAMLEISIPKLLILLCILSVLIPSFVMKGIPKDMFMPLSMAVGFSMIASFIFSQTFVPILANWLMKIKTKKTTRKSSFEKLKDRYLVLTEKLQRRDITVIGIYGGVVVCLVVFAFFQIGTDIMPASENTDIQLRIVAPQGTRLEKTEIYMNSISELIQDEVAEDGIQITSGFAGIQPSAKAINPIFLFTSGSHEAVLQVSIKKDALRTSVSTLKEKLRRRVSEIYPELKISFEPIELIEKIMSQGTNNPVQIRVAARQLPVAEKYALAIQKNLENNDFMRDVRIEEALHYPTVQIDVNRDRAALFGVSMQDASRAITMATASTRFVSKSLWQDPRSGLVFQLQVQVPEAKMQALDELKMLPVKSGSRHPTLQDIAKIQMSEEPGQVNRQGPNRFITISANIEGKDLGSATKAVQKAVILAGERPRGVTVSTPGQITLLKETLSGLESGLGVAIVVIFLMLYFYYQSFNLSVIILSVVPAVVAGSLLMLLLFGSTLNLQSYMGMIMSVGVSVSNAFLLVDFAEKARLNDGLSVGSAAIAAASSRMRPIIMTTLAMIAGMIPMATGFGEGGEQIAPLAQAVIGGLLMSTTTTLLVLPQLFSRARKKAGNTGISLDPDDPQSPYFQTI